MKYQGSKNRIAKDILSVILNGERVKNCKYWVEPFVGGANMIDKVPDSFKKYGYDINYFIISMFQELQNGREFWDDIDEIEYNTCKEVVKKIKNSNNSRCSGIDFDFEFTDGDIGFIGIGCSFAGKWFGGYARGGNRNYCKESQRNLLKQKRNLLNVRFIHQNYLNIKINDPKITIIYCDPPYQGTTKYKDSFDNAKFWNWCDEMINKGCVVYVSEYNAPDGWKCVWEKEIISNLDLNTGVKRATERLFTK